MGKCCELLNNKIVTIGSMNKDIVISVEKIPAPGETIMALSSEEFLGGKGANQAVAISKVCGNGTMLGVVGDDGDGLWLLESLHANGVEVKHINQIAGIPTGLAIVTVEKSGENVITVVPGANHAMDKDYIDQHIGVIEESGYVILQMEIPKAIVEHAIAVSRRLDKFIVLNPAPVVALEELTLRSVDLITPNRSELSLLVGMSVETDAEVIGAAAKLLEIGIKKVIVTLGSKGCYYTDGKVSRFYNGIKVKSIDTTGAGDCFNGILVASLANGFTIDESIIRAIGGSALSVTKMGAQNSMPSSKELHDFMADINVEIREV